MSEVTPDPIMRIATGYMAAKYLLTANSLGIFESLADASATLAELAARCEVPQRTLRIIVDAMVSLGLVEREHDRYRNSPVAAAYLSGRAGSDLRPTLRYFDRMSYPRWLELETAVRAGEGQRQFNRFTSEEQLIFSAGVEALTASTAASLATDYDFSRHRRVLDVAGGTGSFLMAVLRRHPTLQATLFELPGACAVARQLLAGTPEEARVTVVEGDFFKDELPGGHDAIILANTAHVLSPAHNIELLKNMRVQSDAGTRLLLVDWWMDESHSQPVVAALMSAEFLIMSGEGQSYREVDADEWLAKTRWRKLERHGLAGRASLIIAEAI